MKRVYFVRHGQTAMNLKHIHQGPDEPLTQVGQKQAQGVALRLKDKGIDTLVASPFVRARETAAIIGEALDLPYILEDSVKEFRRPNALYGRSHYSFATFLYLLYLFLHRQDPDWDNDGAENMFTVRNRVLNAKKNIDALPGETIVVVSHAIFIDMFTQIACAERPLKLREFVAALVGVKKLPNVGIVAFNVDDNAPPGACKWWLVDEETDRRYLQQR